MKYIDYVVKGEDGSLIIRPSIGFTPDGTIGKMIPGEDIRWIAEVDDIWIESVPVWVVDGNDQLILDGNGDPIQSTDANEDPIFEDISTIVGKKLAVDEALKIIVQAQDADDAAVKSKDDQVSSAYGAMVSDVSAKASVDMFSLSLEGAIANYLELLMMQNNLSKFAAAGLLAEVEVKDSNDVLLFSKGDALNTSQKVSDYASRLIEIAEDYAIYRHTKKDTFRSDKDTILNS